MAEMEQPESPPRPFPARSPEYHRDPFRRNDFAQLHNDDSWMNNASSSSATADDPKSCFIASTMLSFFGNFIWFLAITFHGWVDGFL